MEEKVKKKFVDGVGKKCKIQEQIYMQGGMRERERNHGLWEEWIISYYHAWSEQKY